MKYGDEYVCLSVHSHVENHSAELHQIFCACLVWLWLSPLASGFVDDMFSHNGLMVCHVYPKQ